MKTKTTYFALGFGAGILAVVIFLYAAFFSVSYVVNTSCRHLEAISRDEVLMSALWEQLSKVIEAPDHFGASGLKSHVLFANEIDGNLGIDWEALQIPLEHATLEVRLEGFPNSEFDPGLIEEVRAGYGYRYHLVFRITDEPESRSPDPSQWSYDLSVECRND